LMRAAVGPMSDEDLTAVISYLRAQAPVEAKRPYYDLGLLGNSFKFLSRRKRIGQLEGIVRQNPSAGNYEELGDLYMENGDFRQARTAFDHAITPRTDSLDALYRRGVCALRLNDPQAAVSDLERVVSKEPGYDFHLAAGRLAQAYTLTDQKQKAEAAVRGYFRIKGENYES